MKSYVAGLRQYATFRGRTRRAEFWIYTLVDLLISAGLFAAVVVLATILDGRYATVPAVLQIVFVAYVVLTLVPSTAVRVRRLHDVGRSGAYYLVHLIPLIGPLMLLVEFCMDGTRGPNRYGPDPKLRAAAPALPGPFPAEPGAAVPAHPSGPHQSAPYQSGPGPGQPGVRTPAYGLGWAGRLAVRAGIVVAIILACMLGGAVMYHLAPGPDQTAGSDVHSGR